MTDYTALLGELAVPRLVGSPNHARVRAALTRELAARGFAVEEHRFPASPDALWAVALSGVVLAWGALLAVPLAALPGTGMLLACWVLTLEVGLLVFARAASRGLRLTSHSVSGVNLVAVRPHTSVAVWFTGHYDSKGQPLSMATRLVGALLAGLGFVALLGLVALRVRRGAEGGWEPAWIGLAAPALLGGLLLSRNRPTNDSAGAVDNATALVTILAAVDALPPDAAVGVIFPDAEEYGLLGARALVRERPALFRETAVLNFDGIDDRGAPIACLHRPGATTEAVVRALRARRARLLPALVDGLAFARVARECLTIMRGDWGTARIVHTPRDTADRLTLGGSREVVTAVAQALRSAAFRPPVTR